MKTFKEKFGRSFVSDISTQIKLQTQKAAIDQGGKTLWKDIAKSLETQSTSSSSKLTAKHPAALIRDTGGTIYANKSWLTIPMNEAEGKSVKQMKSSGWTIFRIPGPGGGYLLGKRGKKGRTALLFALRRSVKHPATHWIPRENQLFKTVEQVFAGVKL